ncbi:hypothetical protein LPJ61_000233 [Coemansia biformis]|uniref:Uncharacterized protein n=1 Tax=Coemansia biformis TaxID=1286918 RepID=A0A9W7YGM4_9FUNG|nr:hypothetical protein LPJ61_000233 [Coemansia biformis]
MLHMFKRRVTQASVDWELSPHHPTLDVDDTDPLPARFGESTVLPPEFQRPVAGSFIQELQDATPEHHAGTLEWFNCRVPASSRMSCFGNYIESCGPNEIVWVYVRFRDVIFSILHAAFVQGVDDLNALPERPVSPMAGAMSALWMAFTYLNRLIELVPRLAATGWRQSEIENMLIVLLDHGNNQDVRLFGWYSLGVYMSATNGNYSNTTIDLFTNAVSLQALAFVDRPAASRAVGDGMCAIAAGMGITDIGCGQRAIVGFDAGRPSICPVLQDNVHPINPQGILALRMMRCTAGTLVYLASLAPSPQAVFVELCNSGLINRHSSGGTVIFGAISAIHTQTIRAHDTLRCVMLDYSPESLLFFKDVLRHSLDAMPRLANEGPGTDSLGKEELMEAGYEVGVGALTILRLWLVSKDEYRPVHLATSSDNRSVLVEVISDYLLILLYNGLLVHNIVMGMYRRYLPQEETQVLMERLQEILLLLLSKPASNLQDEGNVESLSNRALSLLTKSVISGWLVQGDPLAVVARRFKVIYMTPTVWTSHLYMWCNVLRALTAARGRHILRVDERVLVQECMFSGQRQRRGMNKVDEYLAKLKDPSYHLDNAIDTERLESATPFHITSGLLWDTTRHVLASTKAAALKEIKFSDACSEQSQSTEFKLADPSSDYQSKSLLHTTQSIYAYIFLSGPRNLSRVPSERQRGILDSSAGASLADASEGESSGLGVSSEQMADVASINGSAAISLLDTIHTRTWQSEAVWQDFHISDFVSAQEDVVRNLQYMWREWVDLLGSPVDTNRGDPVDVDQIQMFLVECRLLLAFGISGSRVLLMTLERGLRRIFLERATYNGSFPDLAIQGAATLLVSMGTLLSNGRVLNAHHAKSKARRFTDSSLVSLQEDSGLVRLIGYADKSSYPTLERLPQAPKHHAFWENGGPIFGRTCDIIWRIALELSHSDIYSYKCSGLVENRILSGMAMVCLSELSIPDKSARNGRLIDNCMAAISSRLFAIRHDVIRMAISSLGAFVIGRSNIVQLLGTVQTSKLITYTMKAIVEQFDRAGSDIAPVSALVVRELLQLLAALLIKSPRLIVHDDESGRYIRDFLVERVIKRCTHPLEPSGTMPHKYNQKLACVESKHGIALHLEPDSNAQQTAMSLSDFVLLAGEEKSVADSVKSIKQMCEALYLKLMRRFDEDAQLGGVGPLSPQPAADCGSSSSCENMIVYSHGCGLLQVCDDPEEDFYRCTFINCTGKHVFRLHYAPEAAVKLGCSQDARTGQHTCPLPIVCAGDVIDDANKQAAIPVIR